MHVYFLLTRDESTHGCWRWNGARAKRPMSSIVLEPAVKEMLLADCKDFLDSEDWYVSCIPGLPPLLTDVACRYAERGECDSGPPTRSSALV